MDFKWLETCVYHLKWFEKMKKWSKNATFICFQNGNPPLANHLMEFHQIGCTVLLKYIYLRYPPPRVFENDKKSRQNLQNDGNMIKLGYFWMESDGTKHAIKSYGLNNIYLPFYFIQKGWETTGIWVRVFWITKYGNFSCFLMESDKTKHAMKFLDLKNLGLPLYIGQKGSETTETVCFDGNCCIRAAINAINRLWHMQFLPKWYTYLGNPVQIYAFHNARYIFIRKEFDLPN